MASNGHAASQNIPPTITRIITKDILNGNPQVHLVWIANAESPVNLSVKIAKMLFRFDADDNPDAIEVYGIGMIDNRAIGVRSTIRMSDVSCTDEVMDIATWTDEIKDAEEDGEEEEEEIEDPEPEPEVIETRPAAKKPEAAALPSSAVPSPVLPEPAS